MTYDSFINQRNPYNNLYNVTRKSDGKELIRGANYNKTMELIEQVGIGTVEIYFY